MIPKNSRFVQIGENFGEILAFKNTIKRFKF